MGKPDATSVSRYQRLEQLHNLEHRALSIQQANTTSDVGGSDMTLINNWMHRTGWNELFAGSDRAIGCLSISCLLSSSSGSVYLSVVLPDFRVRRHSDAVFS
jgi:hypothetical protein